jgi:hypothetical protein
MAEDPKIIPSPPPAEPFDVKVLPDPGPAAPFDVATNPSPPPAEPFDVKVYPDPGPGGTFDVPTLSDLPPVGPFDVHTLTDLPPASPFDVVTSPDGPPLATFDVPTAPDGPPGEPFDVPTAPDGLPSEPFDVQTSTDTPPLDPIDVQTTPDAPPSDPFNVGVTLDAPPADPIDPSTVSSDPGVPPLPDPIGSVNGPTMGDIIRAVKRFDGQLASFLQSLVTFDHHSPAIAGAGALDPRILAAWFRNYQNAVGVTGIEKFMAEQALLHAMNPVAARVFDPTYFIKMMIPGSMGNLHATLDTQIGINAETVAREKDALFQATAIFDQKAGPNVYDSRSGHTFRDGQDFSIDEMVDSAIDGETHAFTSPVTDQRGVPPIQRFDASKYFNDRASDGSQLAGNRARSLAADVNSSPLAASAFTNGVVRVGVPGEIDGAIYSQDQDPSFVVDDDDTRVPLCFTDLRKDPVQNAYRSIYFRPLNLSFSKNISPSWNEGNAFGRVDPIVSYTSTSRTYSVSFELHAFAAEDLVVMYNKMVWLDSMCYPSYGADSLFRSGPVIRMRIGDVVSTESGGLTGVIKSLSFDFSDALWELKKGMKVPRSFKVSLEFLALHEGPVGLLGGQFGVLQLPTPGLASDVDTNDPGGPMDSREEPARQSSILPGRFMKFGEPRR